MRTGRAPRAGPSHRRLRRLRPHPAHRRAHQHSCGGEMTELKDLVRTERLAFIDLLKTLTEDQWRTPSLCSAWTVENVAAHLAWAPIAGPLEMGPAALRAGFRTNRLIADSAVRWTARGRPAIWPRRTRCSTGPSSSDPRFTRSSRTTMPRRRSRLSETCRTSPAGRSPMPECSGRPQRRWRSPRACDAPSTRSPGIACCFSVRPTRPGHERVMAETAGGSSSIGPAAVAGVGWSGVATARRSAPTRAGTRSER